VVRISWIKTENRDETLDEAKASEKTSTDRLSGEGGGKRVGTRKKWVRGIISSTQSKKKEKDERKNKTIG